MFGEQDRLSLRQNNHPGRHFEALGDARKVGECDQRFVEGIGLFIRARQFRFPPGMIGAEDMIIDHDMIVPQVFRRLGERLDRPRVTTEVNLRINYASPHFSASFFARRRYSPNPDLRVRSEISRFTGYDRSRINGRDDDR